MSSSNLPSTGEHVCPWWFAYTFDNFLRRLVHRPETLLGPYLARGMKVLDIGCGMGHFSIGMARMVGPDGRVIAVDLQEKMLDVMMRRARKAGIDDRITPHLCTKNSLELKIRADFALLFWMAHEVPDPDRLFREIHALLTPGGSLLYVEPSFHVDEELFRSIVDAALSEGFVIEEDAPNVRFSRAALLKQA